MIFKYFQLIFFFFISYVFFCFVCLFGGLSSLESLLLIFSSPFVFHIFFTLNFGKMLNLKVSKEDVD